MHPVRLKRVKCCSLLPCRLCHVVVGTPGRLLALLQGGALTPASLHMLVLDEADALLGESFYHDVTSIYDHMPRKKQVHVCLHALWTKLWVVYTTVSAKPQACTRVYMHMPCTLHCRYMHVSGARTCAHRHVHLPVIRTIATPCCR